MSLISSHHGTPVVDLGALPDGTPAQRMQTGQALLEVCGVLGSFFVVNHSLPADALRDALDVSKRFFDLPAEEKMRVHARHCPPFRGYVRTRERKRGSAALLDDDGSMQTLGDFKENYDVGPGLPADCPSVGPDNPFYGPNVWPESPAEFGTVIERYLRENERLTARMFASVALALRLPEDFFARRFTHPISRMKLLHYPPPPATTDFVPEGVGAHADYSVFTILAQDDVGGLELVDRSGAAITVDPLAGGLIVNVGDQLARWTGGRFHPTIHRVVNRARKDRYSIAFFAHPNFDTVMDPHELAGEDIEGYGPVVAGKDLLARLNGAHDIPTAPVDLGAL